MAEDILHKSQENTHILNAQNRIMNYSTNEYFTPSDEVGQYSWNNANKGIQAVAQYLVDNPNVSDADIETILRGNDSYYDVATNYGGHKMADAKWRDAFTIGARGDVIRAARNAANNYNILQSDAAAQAEQAARAEIDARNAANRAAVEARNQAPLIYSRGGNEYKIERGFSDNLKERMQELSVANDAEATGIYAGLKDQLAAMGVKFANGDVKGITGANAMQSLINSGATLQDKIAIRDILSMAANREDEVFEEEKYQAPQDTRSFGDRFIGRQEREAKLERDREQQRIERARAREGFAGLAATIGDMIRASEGAPVNPRDWQQMYDNLTAQERANFNNYQVRMAKLKEDAMRQQMADRQMAAAAAEKEAARAHAEALAQFKEDRADARAAANNQAGIEKANINAGAKIDAAKIAAAARMAAQETAKAQMFEYGGKMYTIAGGESFDACMNDIKAILQNPASWKDGKMEKFAYKPDQMGANRQSFFNERVKNITQSKRGDFANGVDEQIIAYLKAYSVKDPYDSKVPQRKDGGHQPTDRLKKNKK